MKINFQSQQKKKQRLEIADPFKAFGRHIDKQFDEVIEKLKEHDDQIKVLAYHSIKHEAEIESIKNQLKN